LYLELALWCLTWKCLSEMYDFSSREYGLGNLFSSLYNSQVCPTLSKAWAMSKNAAVQYCFTSRLAAVLLAIL
jgi:hypothetical protein